MTLVAKPIVNKQFWIIKDDDKKVGNIQAGPSGYQVTLKNKTTSYKTIPMLSRGENVEFEPAIKASKPLTDVVHGYSTGCRAYNGMWDLKHKLPLFTKTTKSKSWFAAGWYSVKQHRNWKTIHNPKLILLERYQFEGPFHTKEEANVKSVS